MDSTSYNTEYLVPICSTQIAIATFGYAETLGEIIFENLER